MCKLVLKLYLQSKLQLTLKTAVGVIRHNIFRYKVERPKIQWTQRKKQRAWVSEPRVYSSSAQLNSVADKSLAMRLLKRYRHTAEAIAGRKRRPWDSDAGRIRRNRCVKFNLSSLTTSDCRRSLPEHCKAGGKRECCAALMVPLRGVCFRQQTISSNPAK